VATARILRSLVFVPAHDPDLILRAAGNGMDALCLDLEDLTLLPDKEEARAIFPAVAREIAARDIAVFARTNGIAGGMAAADLDAVLVPELHCVSIPKVDHASDVAAFCELLDDAERRKGVAVGSTLVRPIIETALGVRNAFDIASASPRIAYLGGVAGGWWGDLSSSIGYVPSPRGQETAYVRSKVLVDARAAGVPFPIGGGSTSSSHLADVTAFAEDNRQLGYDGVHCAGSAPVVAAVNEVFTPSRNEIAQWLDLLPALEQAERDGLSSTRVGDLFVDLAGLAKVREQLALARRLGLLPDRAGPYSARA